MKNTLYISAPYVQSIPNSDQSRLISQLKINNNEPYTAWYQVDNSYAQYLCPERSDSFLCALLPYAMKHNLDIECEQAISERLHYQLTQHLIPTLSKQIKGFHHINITSPISCAPLPKGSAVGASLSGGVDSFYTLLQHLKRDELSLNITHLTFFNIGASGGGNNGRILYHDRVEWLKEIAEELQLPLLCVDSNIPDFTDMTHVTCHTFRTLSVILALQKLFSYYLFSSGFPYQKFSFNAEHCASYDLLTTQCLSTNNVTFQLTGAERTRLEKVNYISSFPITQRKLNVCLFEQSNCSKCHKCRRTMMELYVLGRLNQYSLVFDVVAFNKQIKARIADICATRTEADNDELFHMLKKEKLIKPYHYIYGKLRSILITILSYQK